MPTLKRRNSISRAFECTESVKIQTPHLSWLEEGNWYFSPTISRSHRQVSPHKLQLQETKRQKHSQFFTSSLLWVRISLCFWPCWALCPCELTLCAVNTEFIFWAIFVYLCFSIPADCSSVPHLPVLDKLCTRAKSGPIRKVLIQKCSHHSWDNQGTWTLWTPAQKRVLSLLGWHLPIHVFSIFNFHGHFFSVTYSGLLCWVARGCRRTGEELPSLWEELHCMPRLSILSCFRISLTSAFSRRFSAFSRCFSAFRKLRSPRR